jgi:hypothetical protein
MEKWLLDNLWAIIVAVIGNLVLGVASFVRLKERQHEIERRIDENRNERIRQIDTITQNVRDVLSELRLHISSSTPHASCPVHATNLEGVQKMLNGAVSIEFCRRTHEDTNRRLDEFHAKLETLQASLMTVNVSIASIRSPLLEMKNWIEEIKNGKDH